MAAAADRRIVLVVRETRLDALVARFNTLAQARFYIEHLGADVGDYIEEHRVYRAALAEIEAKLQAQARLQRLDRRYLPAFVFAPDDLVVVLGPDGLVANTLKYLDGQGVIGVNPDPGRWDGVLLPFRPADLPRLLPEALAGRRPCRAVTMAEAVLNTGEVLQAVNDLFIGPRSHVSARYSLRLGALTERQCSSGIIVSTGLGSTGWLSSLEAGWMAMAGAHGLDVPPAARAVPTPWDAQSLRFCVREPFPSRTTGTSLVTGTIDHATPLTILSEMAENGVIFSDGIEADCLAFDAGVTATIGIAARRGQLVV